MKGDTKEDAERVWGELEELGSSGSFKQEIDGGVIVYLHHPKYLAWAEEDGVKVLRWVLP